MIIQTEAIVIRSTKYSESDCILTLFTRKMGKLSVYAKNVRQIKSPLMSSTQIFAYSNMNLTTRDGKFRISNADLINNHYKLTSEVQKTYLGYYMLEMVDKLSLENQSNIRLFELLCCSLDELQKNKKYILQKTSFELKLLEYTGYKPNVRSCVECGTTQNLGNYFSMDNGGRICQSCLQNTLHVEKFDSTTFRLIEYIQSNQISKILEAQISNQILVELNHMLDDYIKYHIPEVKLKTREYLILSEN